MSRKRVVAFFERTVGCANSGWSANEIPSNENQGKRYS
jgi:hypothetical protein